MVICKPDEIPHNMPHKVPQLRKRRSTPHLGGLCLKFE